MTNKNHQSLKIALFALLLILMISALIYQYPHEIAVNSKAILNSDNDVIINVSLLLTKRNHIFRPAQITGNIIFDGIEYENMATMGCDVFDANSFWKNLQLKFQGFTYDLFVRSDLKGRQIEYFKDTILIESSTDDEIIIRKFTESIEDSSKRTAFYTIKLNP